MFSHDTDPYGHLTFAIGNEDDFWCFDYARDEERGMVRIHAVINSETGSFIMNAEEPVELPEDEAVEYAKGLVDQALDWCADGGDDPIEHDVEGWNQDATWFWRSMHADLTGTGQAIRIPVEMVKRPQNTGNYL